MDDATKQALLLHQQWLDGYADGAQADISSLDFTGEDLSPWDFRQIIARVCNFTSATMPARMQAGDFTGSKFTNAFMARSNVADAILSSCDMVGADMFYTVVLNNTTLSNAKFSDGVVLWMWGRLMQLDYSGNAEAIQSTADGLKTALAAIASE